MRLTAFLWVVLLTGCGLNSALIREVNSKFPPVDPAMNQAAAIAASSSELAAIAPTAYVGLTSADVKRAIPAQLSITQPDGTKIDASGIAVTLGQQEVIVAVPFANVRLDDGTRVGGSVETHCSVAVEKGAIVLRPSLSRIVVRKLAIHGTKVPDALVSLISAVLQPFINNANGAIAAVRVPIDLHQVESIDLAALINGAATPPIREVRDVSGTKLSVDVGIGRAAVLIEPAAARVLVEAVVLTPERIAQVVGGPAVMALSSVGPPTSRDLAVLSECGHGGDDLPSSIRAALAQRCAAGPSFTAMSLAAAPPSTGGDVDAAFTQYRDAFRAKAAAVDRIENLFWDRTAMAVARQPIVDALNETLLTAAAGGSFILDSQSAEIPESDRTLRLDKAPDLKCDDAGGGCPSDPDPYPPYQPRGCPSDCIVMKDVYVFGVKVGSVPTIDLACQAWKPTCEALKESERIAYEASKAAALADFAIRKAACEAVKAGKQAGCRLNQGWLNDWSEADVGEIRGSFTAHDPFLRLTVANPSVGADFSSFGVHAEVSGGTDVQGSFTFIPHNAGHLLCVAEWSGDVHARANVPPQKRDLTLTRTSLSTRSDGLRLTYAMPEIPVHVTFDPPPVKALIEQNPAKLAVNCPVPLVILSQLAQFTPVNIVLAVKLRETILNDSRDVKVPGREVSFTIPRRSIDIGLPGATATSIALTPFWQEKALVFAAR